MKKIIALIIALVAFASCSRDYTHDTTITYRIYYPGHTVERSFTYESTDDPGYIRDSDRGSNYLYGQTKRNGWFTTDHKLEDTSAPIEVTSFVKHKKN